MLKSQIQEFQPGHPCSWRDISGLKSRFPVLSRRTRAVVSTYQFRDVARACTKLPPNTLIDGEVVASMRTDEFLQCIQQSRTNAHIQVGARGCNKFFQCSAHVIVVDRFRRQSRRPCSWGPYISKLNDSLHAHHQSMGCLPRVAQSTSSQHFGPKPKYGEILIVIDVKQPRQDCLLEHRYPS
jgi:hypothetical protein